MLSTGANCNNRPAIKIFRSLFFFTRSTYKLNETQQNSSSCKLQLEGTHLVRGLVFLHAACGYRVGVGLIALGAGLLLYSAHA